MGLLTDLADLIDDVAELLLLPEQLKQLEKRVMATFDEVMVAITAEHEQVIAKITEVQNALDAAIADKQVAVDQATQALLAEQSTKLEELKTQIGGILPDAAPDQLPVEPTEAVVEPVEASPLVDDVLPA